MIVESRVRDGEPCLRRSPCRSLQYGNVGQEHPESAPHWKLGKVAICLPHTDSMLVQLVHVLKMNEILRFSIFHELRGTERYS